MIGFYGLATILCCFLLTYLVHSTVIIGGIALLRGRVRRFDQPAIRVLAWKLAFRALVAGMTAFRSTLGQRVEQLLDGVSSKADVPPTTRLTVLTGLTACAMSAASLVPLAVAKKTSRRFGIPIFFNSGRYREAIINVSPAAWHDLSDRG